VIGQVATTVQIELSPIELAEGVSPWDPLVSAAPCLPISAFFNSINKIDRTRGVPNDHLVDIFMTPLAGLRLRLLGFSSLTFPPLPFTSTTTTIALA
jgi:hypothetical protein